MREGKPRKHVFVCINERPDEHPRGSCIARGSGDIFNQMREMVGQKGLVDIKVTFSGCMEPCMVGPIVYVAPDDVWYGGVTPEDLELILDQHLAGDEPVEWLRIGEEEFALSPLEGRADLPSGVIPPVGDDA